MDKPPKIFVSYAHQHRELVTQLVKFISLADDAIFYDEHIQPGEDWESCLLTALAAAPTFIVFWCEHCLSSIWVTKEIEIAIASSKKIVPVLLDNTSIPPELAKFQWLNLSRTICIAPGNKDMSRPTHETQLSEFDFFLFKGRFGYFLSNGE